MKKHNFSRNYAKRSFKKEKWGRPRKEEDEDSIMFKVRDKLVDHHEKASTRICVYIYIIK